MYAVISILMLPFMYFSFFGIANFGVANNFTEGSLILALLSSFTIELCGLMYTVGKSY